MDIDVAKVKILTNENISYLLAYYETYYQLSYGFYISYTSGFDIADSTKKVKELKPKVNKEFIVLKIVESIDNSKSIEDIKEYFRISSSLKALEDFLESDNELLNKAIFRDLMIESIGDGTLFKDQLSLMFMEVFPIRLNIWKGYVDEGTIKEITVALDHLSHDRDIVPINNHL